MDRQARTTVYAFAALVVIATVPPLVAIALDASGGLPVALELLGSARGLELLGRSLALATAVSALSVTLGFPLGLLFGRSDCVGRRVAFALHAFPLFVPPFLLALGWFDGLRAISGSASALFSFAGAAGVLVLALSPIVTFLTARAAAAIDESQVEAGLVVAKPLRVLARVVAPQCAGAAALGAVMVFALCFGELGVAAFLRVDVYAAAVFSRLGGVSFAPGEAAALAIPLLAVAFGLFAIERLLGARLAVASLVLRAEVTPPIPLRGARALCSVFGWIVCLLGVAPLFALAGIALGGLGEVGVWLDSSQAYGLAASATAALVVTALGVVLGHALTREPRAVRAVNALTVLAFVAPPTVLAVGMLRFWNRSAFAWVYGSMAVVILALVARYAVLGIRACASAFATTSVVLEDAARLFGASYLRRLLRIVAPLHQRSIAAVFFIVLVFCWRDLDTPMLLYPAGRAPLLVQVFTLEANGPPSVVAALALVHVMLSAALGAAAYLAIRPQTRAR